MSQIKITQWKEFCLTDLLASTSTCEGHTWDEIEDDLDWENCIEIPHKNDLDLGHELVFEFVEDHLADDFERVRQMFRKRGAYGRFKHFLESKDLLQNL